MSEVIGLVDKSLTRDELQVLEQLAARNVALNHAREAAAATGDALQVVNAVRQQRGERILSASDLPRLATLNSVLVQVAQDPFGPLPTAYATYVATVSSEDVTTVDGDERGRFDLYERQLGFPDSATLLRRLQDAAAHFPAFRPRLHVLERAVMARMDIPGPAYLYYAGCSVSGTPESRASNDFQQGLSFYKQLVRFWGVESVKVYRINLGQVVVNPYEYRANRELQNEEHTLISMRFPLCLNSAPGGFNHEFSVDRFPAKPLPRLTRDPVPPAMIQALQRHFRGMYSIFAEKTRGRGIDPAALDAQIEMATPRFTVQGQVPIVAVTKDITQEAFEHRHAELSYRERLAGPGPHLANAALLHQHGIADPYGATTEEKMEVLPPIADLFSFFGHH